MKPASLFKKILFLALMISASAITQTVSSQPSYVSFQVFYDELSPYGQWLDNPDYGYVWLPDAGPDFVPYSTDGHWIMTEYGWTWVSDYSWGWAPFHYGRWGFDNSYGWYWVPDNEWGPSWVTWRRADGYYGWAPMEPGLSVSLSFGREYDSHNDHWMFVRDRDFERSDINHYYIDRNEHERIIQNSVVIKITMEDSRRHSTYVAGPAREDVQKATGRRITPVAVEDNNKPGQDVNNGQMRIYRPQVNATNGNERKPAPANVVKMNEVKPPAERKATYSPRNNTNTQAQPAQPQRSNPAENKREPQPNAVQPQHNDNPQAQPAQPQHKDNPQAQPAQPRKPNPPVNGKIKQQPASTNPSRGNNKVPPREVKPKEDEKRAE
jgi:hypothetical protein